MPLGLKIGQKDGFYHLVGSIDEHADFRTLTVQTPPLKVNMRGVQSVNSLGIRSFIKFMSDLGTMPVELHELSPAVLDMINTFPSTLGTPHQPERVQSIFVIYRCDHCAKDFNVLLKREEFVKCHHRFPGRLCNRCQNELEAPEPEELLLFMLCPD